MGKIALLAGIVVAVILIAAVGYYMLSGNGNPENELVASINGSDYTYAEMKDEFGTETVDGKEGVPLDAIVVDTNLANPETHAYVLKSEDGYAMAVNWTAMQGGIVTLVEETGAATGEEISYLMSVFPGLPSAFKVKYLVEIEPKAGLISVACNGIEYYLDYMPKKVEEKLIVYNSTYSPSGWSLSDMVNYTGLENPETHEYTIVGYNAADEDPWYNRTVTWAGMLDGVLIEENTKTVFAESTEYDKKSYMVKFVIEIIVE